MSVDGKTGANGLSLPTSALPWNRPVTMSGRLSVSAMAWRTRGSVNGAWSVRIESSRCALDFRLITVMLEFESSDWPPDTENWPMTSIVPPCSARISGSWVS